MKGIEAIKGFKEKFGSPSKEILERNKYNNKCMSALKKVLADNNELTVPQAAEKTGIPADEVMWYFNAMRKYGIIVITGDEGDYKKYSLKRGTD